MCMLIVAITLKFCLSFFSITRKWKSESPEPSGVSVKSNRSRESPYNFSEGTETSDLTLVFVFANLLYCSPITEYDLYRGADQKGAPK